MKKHILGLILFCFCIKAPAQLGGIGIMKFLANPPSARVSALGGIAIATRDDDPNLAFQNPALLNDESNRKISFSHRFFYNDIQDGYVSYAQKWKETGINVHTGFQYAGYGDITAADIKGNPTGTISAKDVSFTIGASKLVYDRLSLGVNLRYGYSRLNLGGSNALLADFGANYFIADKNLSIALVARNIGFQIDPFQNEREPLPYEMQIGITKKLNHLPFRFGVFYTNAQRWNILYDDPNLTDGGATLFNQDQPTERSKTSIFVDNFFRHLVFNGEFYIGKKENLRLRLGYNHLLRKEMTVNTFRTLAGFSGGFGFKVNRFRIDYGSQYYHLAGRYHQLSLMTDLDWFNKGG